MKANNHLSSNQIAEVSDVFNVYSQSKTTVTQTDVKTRLLRHLGFDPTEKELLQLLPGSVDGMLTLD